MSAPFSAFQSSVEPSPGLQFVMVRLVTSQWVEPVTLLSVLANVTNQDTLWLVPTVKVVLLVVSDAGEAAPVSD